MQHRPIVIGWFAEERIFPIFSGHIQCIACPTHAHKGSGLYREGVFLLRWIGAHSEVGFFWWKAFYIVFFQAGILQCLKSSAFQPHLSCVGSQTYIVFNEKISLEAPRNALCFGF